MTSSYSKKLPAFLRRISLTHNADFYCLSYFHSFRTKSRLESQEKVLGNKDFCVVGMPFEENMLEFNQYLKI